MSNGSLVGFQDAKILRNVEAIDTESFTPFKQKDVLNVTDSGSNYTTGTILFNTQQTAASGYYVIWAESWLSIPFAMRLTILAGTTVQTEAAMPLSMKNGTYQFIDSIQCNMNGIPINNTTPYLNIINNYKPMCEISTNRLPFLFKGECLYPDGTQSAWIGGSAAVGGLQEYNNIATTLPNDSGTGLESYNTGLRQRSIYLNNLQYWGGGGSTAVLGTGANSMQNSFVVYTAATGEYLYNWNIIIPLKRIHPFFAALDFPVKNTLWNIQLNMNLGGNGAGNTCPFIYTTDCGYANSSGFTNGLAGQVINANLNISQLNPITIGTATIPATAPVTLQSGSVYWYYPYVVLNEKQNSGILNNYKERIIKYIDPQSQIYTAIGTNAANVPVTITSPQDANADTITVVSGTNTLVTRAAGTNQPQPFSFAMKGGQYTITITGGGAYTFTSPIVKVISATQLVLQFPAPTQAASAATTTYSITAFKATNYIEQLGLATMANAAAALVPVPFPFSGSAMVTIQQVPTITNVRRWVHFFYMSSVSCPAYLAPLKSPFSSAPGTLGSPGLMISNINATLNGVNIFQRNITSDMWLWYQIELQQLMGGSSDDNVLQSGLFNSDDFQRCGRPLDLDLTRSSAFLANPALGVTLQLTFNNSSPFGPLDDFSFFIQERALLMKLEAGTITSLTPILLTNSTSG